MQERETGVNDNPWLWWDSNVFEPWPDFLFQLVGGEVR